MKLHFESEQEFQKEAVKAIIDIFEGQQLSTGDYEFLIAQPGALLPDKVVLRQAQDTEGNYYSVNDGELIIALEEMNQNLIDTIISAKPKKVITLDNLFSGNDRLKTNKVLQMRDAEIDFKTI